MCERCTKKNCIHEMPNSLGFTNPPLSKRAQKKTRVSSSRDRPHKLGTMHSRTHRRTESLSRAVKRKDSPSQSHQEDPSSPGKCETTPKSNDTIPRSVIDAPKSEPFADLFESPEDNQSFNSEEDNYQYVSRRPKYKLKFKFGRFPRMIKAL